jgi:hypothetical protein
MANSKKSGGTYWNEPVPRPVNVHEGDVCFPIGSATGSEEQGEKPEVDGGFDDLEDLPGPMDLDIDMKSETVTESWADSMDGIDIHPSNFQGNIDEMDSTTAERQNNVCEDHTLSRCVRGSRDSWRPARSQGYRWNQPRTNTWRGFRGGGFRGRNPRDRDHEPRRRESSGNFRETAYRNPQCFIPRGPSNWSLQTSHDGTNFRRTGPGSRRPVSTAAHTAMRLDRSSIAFSER